MKNRILNSILSLFMVLCVFDSSVFTQRVYAEDIEATEEPVMETAPETEETDIEEAESPEETVSAAETPAEPEEIDEAEEPQETADPAETEPEEEPEVIEEEIPEEPETPDEPAEEEPEPEAEIFADGGDYLVTVNANGGDFTTIPEGARLPDGTIEWACLLNKKTKPSAILAGYSPVLEGYHVLGLDPDLNAAEPKYKLDTAYNYASKKGAEVYLYVIWEKDPYQVTLHANGGAFKDGTEDMTFDHIPEKEQAVPAAPSRTGYTLLGWAASADSTEPEYLADTKYTDFEPKELYAVWKATEYTVKLVPKGGLIGDQTESAAVSVTYTVEDVSKVFGENAVVRNGYNLVSWCSDSDLKKPVDETKFLTKPGTIKTLYAKWTGKKYLVVVDTTTFGTFKDKDGNPVQKLVFEHVYGTPVSIYSKLKQNPGVKADGREVFFRFYGYNHESSVIVTEAPDFKADTKYSSFWEDGREVEEGGTVAVYACFTYKTNTLTFKPNGGIIEGQTKAAKTLKRTFTLNNPGEVFALMANESSDGGEYLTRKGYLFKGWYGNKKFTGEAMTTEDILRNIETTNTLYAKWEAKNYNVTLDANNGRFMNGMETLTAQHTYGYKTSISKLTGLRSMVPVCNEPGYKFLGWSADPAAETVTYKNTKKYAKFSADGENVTLTAVYQPISYTVTLYPNSGILAGQTKTKKTIKKSYTVEDLPDIFGEGYLTRKGYTFGGWYKDAAFTQPLSEEDFRTTPGIKKAYAKWNPITYTIYMNRGSHGGFPDPYLSHTKMHTVGEAMTLQDKDESGMDQNAITPHRGYKFLGWSATEGAAKAQYVHTKAYKAFGTLDFDNPDNPTTHLYAVYSPITYKVTLKTNGGILKGAKKSVATATKSYTVESVSPLFAEDAITRKGYTFGGWYKDAALSEEVDEYTFRDNCGDIKTLYAKWIPNE